MNTYDTGLIQKDLEEEKYQWQVNKPDIHILNTCAVTAEATSSALKQARRFKRKNADCTVVVTGCAAQVDTDVFTSKDEIDLVIANSHKEKLPQIIENYLNNKNSQRVFKSNIFRQQRLGAGGGFEKNHTRAFLKIQDGCDSFCSFCVIPYARGTSRSLPFFNLLERVNELYDQGYREVVLTGVHIGDYKDKVEGSVVGLEELVEGVLKSTPMPRVRLSSLEPPELTPRLLELYTDPKMCAHFHMSIQSASTKVLKDMKRQYSFEHVERALLDIEKTVPHAFVGMDIIVGFPTETDQDFHKTHERLVDLPWSKIHVFPYSERPGTKAATFKSFVPLNVRKQRSKTLRQLSAHRYLSEALKQIDTHRSVMILNKPCKGAQGVADNYWPVSLPEEETQKHKGQLLDVSIIDYRQPSESYGEGHLVGQII